MRFHVLVNAEIEASDIDDAMEAMSQQFDLDIDAQIIQAGSVQVHPVSDCAGCPPVDQ